MDAGNLIDINKFTDEEKIIVKGFQLLSSKPTFYIANISDNDSSNEMLNQLEDFAKKSGCIVVPTCIKIEQEIALLDESEKNEYLELLGYG